MKPNFEAMTNEALKAYALTHRDELEPLQILFGRRSPDSEAVIFQAPKNWEDWQQQMETIRPILERDRQSAKDRNPRTS
ncbi:MAG: hypothetical protein MUF49_19105 [Oculatellaceae cyanobacterium Prado106]|jgi:hypothetical protein|nr:hypothetical protein [Oculatellaceae cyanobacterium Prado106]